MRSACCCLGTTSGTPATRRARRSSSPRAWAARATGEGGGRTRNGRGRRSGSLREQLPCLVEPPGCDQGGRRCPGGERKVRRVAGASGDLERASAGRARFRPAPREPRLARRGRRARRGGCRSLAGAAESGSPGEALVERPLSIRKTEQLAVWVWTESARPRPAEKDHASSSVAIAPAGPSRNQRVQARLWRMVASPRP